MAFAVIQSFGFHCKRLNQGSFKEPGSSLYCCTVFVKSCIRTGDGMDVNGAVMSDCIFLDIIEV